MIKERLISKFILIAFSALCIAELLLVVKYYLENFAGATSVLMKDGTNVGGDFPVFYAIGRIFSENRREIYNFSYQFEALRALFVNTRYENLSLVFVYPPPLAALFSLFRNMSLFDAYISWVILSIAIFLLGSYLVISRQQILPSEKFFLLLIGLGFLPFCFNCLGGGQLSVFGFLIFSLAYLCRTKKLDFLEGAVLGLGFYKPPLFLFIGLLALVEGRWRVALGGIVSILLLLLLSLHLVGVSVLTDYIVIASHYRYGIELTSGLTLPPFRGVGFFAFINQHFPNGQFNLPIFAVCLISLLLLVKSFKLSLESSPAHLPLIFSAEICLSVFFSIQCINYDLTLIIPSFYLAAAHVLKNSITFGSALLIICMLIFHFEWMLRLYPNGFEYSPVLPPLLALWSVLLMKTSLESKHVFKSHVKKNA